MKTHLKHLLGLALMVLIFSGCQNPPETPEVNEPPVVETPEDISNLTKVEFRWGTEPNVGSFKKSFENFSPRYLLDLHFDSDLNDYAYGIPEFYYTDEYKEIRKDEESFEKFSKDVFEKVFGTKYYKEGTVIDLKKWTYEAVRLTDMEVADCLQFSTTDLDGTNGCIVKDPFDEIVVGNEDIVVYVFWDSGYSKYSDLYGI